MFLLHFLLIKRNYFIFDLLNFSVDADQNATFPLLTYLRLTQFCYTEIGNFPDDVISFNEIHNFDTLIWATFMMILCFWSSDVIFKPREASFPMILRLERDMQFLSGGYFAFSWYSMKKTDSTNRHNTLFLARSNKNLKITQNPLTQNFHDGDMMYY